MAIEQLALIPPPQNPKHWPSFPEAQLRLRKAFNCHSSSNGGCLERLLSQLGISARAHSKRLTDL